MPLPRSLSVLTMVAAALLMTACGGGSSSPKASSAPSETSAATTPSTSLAATSATTEPSSTASTAPASTTSATAAPPTSISSVGGDCGNATVAVNKATNASPESNQVLDIELKGGCAEVTLATILAAGSSGAADTALKICQTAATPAYHNGVGAVSVLAVGGTELAAGTKTTSCVRKA